MLEPLRQVRVGVLQPARRDVEPAARYRRGSARSPIGPMACQSRGSRCSPHHEQLRARASYPGPLSPWPPAWSVVSGAGRRRRLRRAVGGRRGRGGRRHRARRLHPAHVTRELIGRLRDDLEGHAAVLDAAELRALARVIPASSALNQSVVLRLGKTSRLAANCGIQKLCRTSAVIIFRATVRPTGNVQLVGRDDSELRIAELPPPLVPDDLDLEHSRLRGSRRCGRSSGPSAPRSSRG